MPVTQQLVIQSGFIAVPGTVPGAVTGAEPGTGASMLIDI
jgi:hypothetical protein